jgi:Putative undecaprenyl diphosphate synthase
MRTGTDRCREPHMSLLPRIVALRDKSIDRFRCALLAVLRSGPIPQHVAFVMDGNRRYARTKGMKVLQGHIDGFVALRRVRLTFPSNASTARERISKARQTAMTGFGNMLSP